ncbi:MAG: anhydro-N-acetylmuramic acid kinase [Pedobacter sp.]|nr:anhydro-N-acetylmuramic acid kinase [Chitinophagaceae bacterium]
MNKNIAKLFNIANKRERIIIGLMSGTSLDGLDVALCQFTGSGTNTKIELLQFETIAYNSDFKDEIKSIFSKRMVDLEKVCLLNEWVGVQHGKIINNCLEKWGISNETIDVIASHGQTIYHAPQSLHSNKKFGHGTLQIGDGDHLAVTTNIITISDFRQKHIAAGAEGAPLAVYGDYLIFSQQNENRIMLNIGGIANFTYLPGSLDANSIFSSDVGPGNTLMDAYVQQHFPGKYYDVDATIAKQGHINKGLLLQLKQHPFFTKNFPKTTGPELFNLSYLEAAKQKENITEILHEDVMATLNRFSADCIVNALLHCISANEEYIVYTSGGGMHNPLLLKHLQEQLPNITFKNTNDLAVNPDAKEAILFAILANENLCGGNTNFGDNNPNISMGKISFPW